LQGIEHFSSSRFRPRSQRSLQDLQSYQTW